ncbi:MAG: hypothetical protein RBR67_17225 [Desulfobacterium sp.]|nr:hypothetical protein [Desulfobacterium sp.]
MIIETAAHNQWVDVALKQSNKRDSTWTQSIAVGDKVNGQKEVKSETGYELKETQKSYGNIMFHGFKVGNMLDWEIKSDNL